jgi:hypothetical protein
MSHRRKISWLLLPLVAAALAACTIVYDEGYHRGPPPYWHYWR